MLKNKTLLICFRKKFQRVEFKTFKKILPPLCSSRASTIKHQPTSPTSSIKFTQNYLTSLLSSIRKSPSFKKRKKKSREGSKLSLRPEREKKKQNNNNWKGRRENKRGLKDKGKKESKGNKKEKKSNGQKESDGRKRESKDKDN